MKLFIDTADVAQIKEAYSWGIIDGVTTNPTHVSKTGRKPGEVYREICAIVNGPISLETIGLTAEESSEGRELAKIHKNVVDQGAHHKEGLKAVKQFSAEGYQDQCHGDLLAVAGAAGRQSGRRLHQPLRRPARRGRPRSAWTWCARSRRSTTITASRPKSSPPPARHPLHVLEAALAGADIMHDELRHAQAALPSPADRYRCIEQFLNDWAKSSSDSD